jgi:hypothetical protein
MTLILLVNNPYKRRGDLIAATHFKFFENIQAFCGLYMYRKHWHALGLYSLSVRGFYARKNLPIKSVRSFSFTIYTLLSFVTPIPYITIL